MRCSCQGCGAVYTIPDQKVSQSTELRFSCPKCRNIIELERDDLIQDSEAETDLQPADLLKAETDFQENAPTFEAVEEGIHASLVWVSKPPLLEKLLEILQRMAFRVTTANNPRQVLYRLRQNPYDLVVLDNGLRQSEMSAGLLPQINHLPMPVRRRFMLCLLSETMPTFDRMDAFKAGANLIINVRDVEKAAAILNKGIKEHRSSYRIFLEELEKKGQL